MSSNTHLADVTQLFNLQSNLAIKPSVADFQAEQTDQILRVEAHSPGVFRLRFGSLKQIQPEKVSLRAQQQAEMLLVREDAVGEFSQESLEHEGGWRVEQGEYALVLNQAPFSFALYKGDELLLQSAPSGVWQDDKEEQQGWNAAFALQANDVLYGLGDTQESLNRDGQQLLSDLPEHRVLPLLWSTKGWGVYVNTLERVEHSVAVEEDARYSVRASAPVLDVFLFAGAPTEILNQYTALTGRAGQPGVWPMGVWLQQAAGQSIEDTLSLSASLAEQGVGLDGVMAAAPALYGFMPDRPLFVWDEARVQDGRDLSAKIEKSGVQLAAHTFPGVIVDTPLFEEWEDRGWLLIDDDTGAAYQFEGDENSAGKPFGLLDLTHKDVFKMWVERQRQNYDEGLGAPICTVSYNIPDSITARGGECGALLRTVYPILVRQALFEAFAGHKTPQEGVIWSTNLFPGVQRYSMQLGPDVSNDWEGMERSLRSALALGNSGVTAQMHKLGNAEASTSDMTAELYIRWLAMGVFSANFCFQAIPALLPSAFDEKTQELVQHWLRWRYRLVPYILGIIEESVRCGLPVQRSMALEFPDDPVAQQWDTQYMLGSALLVAPFLQSGEEMEVYLPAGSAWWDLSTGWRYEGGTTWTVTAGLDRLPVFGREGHMLCLGPEVNNTSEFNSARLLEEVWMFGMPEHSPEVMRNKIRVMQMQGSSYIKGLEGLKILPAEGLEVKRRGAEVRISRAR
ncbi:MAG: glycoside hydrolase family 31 protein [Paenalcaligenes sp.]